MEKSEGEMTTKSKERWTELLLTLHCCCVKWKTCPQGHKDFHPLKCVAFVSYFSLLSRVFPSATWFSLRHLITTDLCNRFGKGMLCAPIPCTDNI